MLDFCATLENLTKEVDMKTSKQIFYYSRQKLGFYLLFNIALLFLAVLFTLTIFPNYAPAYYFAIGSCSISLLGAIAVFIIKLPLATVSAKSIKIDRGQPLEWKSIKSVKKIKVGHSWWRKPISKIEILPTTTYKYNFMQKISAQSDFGAFSIPLYAMNKPDAKLIEQSIRKHIKPANKHKKRIT